MESKREFSLFLWGQFVVLLFVLWVRPWWV